MTHSTPVDEKAMLLSYLNAQREHVLGTLEGLSDEDLRRAMMPSRWTALGLVRHLALDVERFWFRIIVAGESIGLDESPEARGPAWQVPPGVSVEAVFDIYRREIERANAVIAGTPLDSPPAWWPEDRWPHWRLQDLQQTILHVTTETACHAGHLDAVRELLDGRTWLVVTE